MTVIRLEAIDEVLIGKPASEMDVWPIAVNPDYVVALRAYHRDVTGIEYQVGGRANHANVRGSVDEIMALLFPA